MINNTPMTRAILNGNNPPIIDMHAHMGNYGGCRMIADTPEKVLCFMNRSNVRLTLFCGHAALFEGAHGIGMDLDTARMHSSRFKLYYPVLSPILHTYAGTEALDRCPEYVGFKFLSDYYRVPLSDRRHDFIWRYADERRLLVLCHTAGASPYDGPEEAERVLARWPNVLFIAGHSFTGEKEKAATLAQKYPNLYLELTALMPFPGQLEYFVASGLEDRLLFGVDAPWFSYESYIGSLLSADISDEVREKIFFKNARGVLERSGAEIDWSTLLT